jgi:hypothetical protein
MPALADFPELVGFFSYSREDDEGSRGALSALRDAIQRELSAQLGRSKSNAQHNRADERGRVGPAARFDSARFRVAAAQLDLVCGRNCGAAAVLVLVWQVFASLRGNPLLVPGPAAVMSEAWMYPGELLSNAAIIIAKLLAAFLLSVPCALSLVRLMQARPALAGVLLPFLRACTAVPGVLLLPERFRNFCCGLRHLFSGSDRDDGKALPVGRGADGAEDGVPPGHRR